MTTAGCHGILIVEDDTDIRETMIEILADNDWVATGAENGAVALERLRSADERPCLILLDMMMPLMDGKTFRHEQQADPLIASIPVVVLTAHPSGESTAQEMQVEGFLKKPIDLDRLLAVVAEFCARPER